MRRSNAGSSAGTAALTAALELMSPDLFRVAARAQGYAWISHEQTIAVKMTDVPATLARRRLPRLSYRFLHLGVNTASRLLQEDVLLAIFGWRAPDGCRSRRHVSAPAMGETYFLSGFWTTDRALRIRDVIGLPERAADAPIAICAASSLSAIWARRRWRIMARIPESARAFCASWSAGDSWIHGAQPIS